MRKTESVQKELVKNQEENLENLLQQITEHKVKLNEKDCRLICNILHHDRAKQALISLQEMAEL